MNMNDKVRTMNAEIKKVNKERKEYAFQAAHHHSANIRKSAQELVDMYDVRLAKLHHKRDCLVDVMTRNIF